MPLRTFIISFLAICIACKPSTLLVPEDDIKYLAMTILILLVPIVHLIFSCRVTQESLEDEQFLLKWGTLYGTTNTGKGWKAIFALGVFFIRRVLFAAILNENLSAV